MATTNSRYTVGGVLRQNNKTYVERVADRDLLNFCQTITPESYIHFILAPRQMGKSSLKEHTISKLKAEEIVCPSITFQAVKTRDSKKFWRGFTFKICREMQNRQELIQKLNKFWEDNCKVYSPPDCFTFFLLDEILPSLKAKKVIIFIDEIQTLIARDLQDEFIQCLRNIYENSQENILQKLGFVLIGVAKINDFTHNVVLNNNETTELTYLSGECTPLQKGLEEVTDNPRKILERILYWTNGQPFLTQLFCYLVLEDYRSNYIEKYAIQNVDNLVEKEVIAKWINQKSEKRCHFQEIQKFFLSYDSDTVKYKLQVLNYYEKQILNQGKVKWQSWNEIQSYLLMSGLVIKANEDEKTYLKIANRIYERIFTYTWTDEIRQRLMAGNVNPEEEELSIEELDNHGVIKRGLKILEQSLQLFVEGRMNKYLGEDWENNREVRAIVRPPNDESLVTIIDSRKLLTLIIDFWENVFVDVFEKSEVEALLKFCNDEEKQMSSLEDDLAGTVLNRIIYILVKIGYSSQQKEFEELDEIMMNKYPEMMNYFLDTDRNNTLGYNRNAKKEKKMAASALPPTIPTFNKTKEPSNNMDRSSRIAEILNKRRPRGKNVQNLLNKLNSLLSKWEELESVSHQLVTNVDDASATEKLQALPFFEKKKEIKAVKQTLEKLQKRFSRECLTIAFVGSAGQGKSRCIQSLTGLTKTEVPDGTMNNCTGVRMTIANSSDGRGEVYLHTPESFLRENIAPYYRELKLGDAPITLDEFTGRPLPKLNIDTTKANAYYRHLDKCWHHYAEYKDLLQENSPKNIGRNEIRQYVAQTDDNNERNNFYYLAVREVKIYCQFPSDVGQIALIDLPGLGDTVLGDLETLRRSLGEDVDFALFVNMPRGRILQKEDYELFDTANQALLDLPIKDWSFAILNEVKNPPPDLGIRDNRRLCEKTKDRIDTEGLIQVADCIIVDCANPDEVSEKVLLPMLDYLGTHILELDAQYAAIANQDIEQLERETKAFLEKARQAFTLTPPSQSPEQNLFRLTDELIGKISRRLETLVDEIRPETLVIEENQKDSEFFKTATINIIKQCHEDTGVPSPEKIYEIYFKMRKPGWITVLQRCINELRIHISKKFSSFDSGFEVYVEQVKNQIAEALTNTELGNLTPSRGSDFLEFMAREIPENYSILKKAFEKLASFQITYELHLEHLILQALEEELDPNVVGTVFDPVGKSDQENIEIIHQVLVVKHRNTVSKCRQALGKLEGMPSIIVYARANRFVDEVLRAEDILADWYPLVQTWSSRVFPDQFGQGINQDQQKWETSIQEAVSLSTLNKI